MLIYIIERFVAKKKYWDIQRDDISRLTLLFDYRHNLINNGFLCRKLCTIYEDTKDHILYLNGILSSKDAIDDSRVHPNLYNLQSKINSELACERTYQSFMFNPEYSYCQHEQWKYLILMNDHIYGTPSLTCGECGGLVAQYRINMSHETSQTLWKWERQHDAIEDISSLCCEYESWADKQLYDIFSKINELGLSIVLSLTREMGCDVYYLFDPGEIEMANCPRCNKPMQICLFKKSFLICNSCRIIIKQYGSLY